MKNSNTEAQRHRDGWRKVRLGEIADCTLGKMLDHKKNHGTPRQYLANYNVRWGEFDLADVSLMPFEDAELDKYRLQNGDLVVCEGGEIGRCALWRDEGEMFIQKALHRVRVHAQDCDVSYLYYWFLNSGRKDFFRQFTTGATILHLPRQNLIGIPVDLPPLPIQRRIAEVLGAYDDAIENNRRRIALLEKMARELYRERFVRRAGKRKSISIGDVCSVQYGYAFNGKLFNAKGEGLPIIRIRNIPTGMSNDYTSEKAPDCYRVTDGEVLVGMDGEFHINLWSGGEAYLVQRSCCFRPFDNEMKGYLMEAIRAPIKYFESAAMGATVGHLGKKDIDTITIHLPSEEEKSVFADWFEERLALALQNRNLARQRDRLLPRLMSGRLEVGA